MYCSKCGDKIKEDSAFCGKCGNVLNKVTTNPKIRLSKFRYKSIIIPCIVIVGVMITYLIVFSIGKQTLKSNLMKDWSRIETGDSGAVYKLELSFSENEIKYNFVSPYSFLNTTIATYKYKVVSPNKIKINDNIYKIKFDDTKTTIIMTPALTHIADSEGWHYMD